MDLIYGDDYILDVTSGDKCFTVQLTIRLKKDVIKHEKDQVLIG